MQPQDTTWSTAIEVVLSRNPNEGTYLLAVYNANESLATEYPMQAIGDRPAQLEATAFLKAHGWEPVTRYWSGDEGESQTRKFRKVTPS